ncbi:MAG: Y-family DNA polymerase [Muribaculaceae bacterium]|nr:Y-family DNA polymerase [Muribaculaceae bacterium]
MVGLVDCNNFFVSCERVFRPELIGKPVVVLSNNDGCAVALSNEAKLLGFERGNPFFKIRDVAERNGVYVFSGNHKLYGDMSNRVILTLRSLADNVEVYSIDEAFFEINDNPQSLHEHGKYIGNTIRRNTGIPVSVGIAPTKTLAKIATSFAKKYPGYAGACVIDTPEKAEKAMALTDVRKVWGVGRRNNKKLNAEGIYTALQLSRMTEQRVRSLMSVTGVRTWLELNGVPAVMRDDIEMEKKSITASRSFASDVGDIDMLRQAVSVFAEIVGRKLRDQNAFTRDISVFIATNRFNENTEQYYNCAAVRLPESTNDTSTIAKLACDALASIYRPQYKYKRAGITISDFEVAGARQQSLFSNYEEQNRRRKLMSVMDSINASPASYNRVHLASSGAGLSDLTRREHASRLYSTRLSDIITINCKK